MFHEKENKTHIYAITIGVVFNVVIVRLSARIHIPVEVITILASPVTTAQCL